MADHLSYQTTGHLVYASSGSLKYGKCPACPSSPASCYQIASYADGDFGIDCGDCPDSSGLTAWDGTFYYESVAGWYSCIWSPAYTSALSIRGGGTGTDPKTLRTRFNADTNTSYTRLFLNPSSCYWWVSFSCHISGNNSRYFWAGTKAWVPCSTPAGVYARRTICNCMTYNPTSLTIEACP